MSVVDGISRIEWQTTSNRLLRFSNVLCSLVGHSSYVWLYCIASSVSQIETNRLYLNEEAGCCNKIVCRLDYEKIRSIRYLIDIPTCCVKTSLPCFTVSAGSSLLFSIKIAYRYPLNIRKVIVAKPKVQGGGIVEETGSVMSKSDNLTIYDSLSVSPSPRLQDLWSSTDFQTRRVSGVNPRLYACRIAWIDWLSQGRTPSWLVCTSRAIIRKQFKPFSHEQLTLLLNSFRDNAVYYSPISPWNRISNALG